MAVGGFFEKLETVAHDRLSRGLGRAVADEDITGLEKIEVLNGGVVAEGVELPIELEAFVRFSGVAYGDADELVSNASFNVFEAQAGL